MRLLKVASSVWADIGIMRGVESPTWRQLRVWEPYRHAEKAGFIML